MNVCFVYSDLGGIQCYGARKYHHGLGQISAVLKAAGHATSLVYLQEEPMRDAFLRQVEQSQPNLVGFSCTTHQHQTSERCAGWIKEAHPDWFLLAGGVHVTLATEEMARCTAFDALCVGEGEAPTLELVERLEGDRSPSDICNLWVRQGADWARNPLRPLVADLDTLPYVDRDLFDFDAIIAANGGWADLMAGRGCPYQCTYCCNPALRERYRGLGRYVRTRSVAHVMGEIEHLAGRYPIRKLNFQDDVFTLDKAWTQEFCAAYRGRFSFPFWINTRVEALSEEVVRALADAGCQGVRVGVESGNETLRREVLRRDMSDAAIREAFKRLRRHGLQTHTCNMIGIPGETPAMIEQTIQMNRELAPTHLQFSVFYPYPLTELYERAKSHGWLDPEHTLAGYYARESALRLPTLTAEELAQEYDRFSALKAELLAHHEASWYYRARRHLRALLRGQTSLRRELALVMRRVLHKARLGVFIVGVLILIVEGDAEAAWTWSTTMTSIGDVWAIPVT